MTISFPTSPCCFYCKRPASYRCDLPVADATSTCSRRLCGGHAKRVGPNQHHCRMHGLAREPRP